MIDNYQKQLIAPNSTVSTPPSSSPSTATLQTGEALRSSPRSDSHPNTTPTGQPTISEAAQPSTSTPTVTLQPASTPQNTTSQNPPSSSHQPTSAPMTPPTSTALKTFNILQATPMQLTAIDAFLNTCPQYTTQQFRDFMSGILGPEFAPTDYYPRHHPPADSTYAPSSYAMRPPRFDMSPEYIHALRSVTSHPPNAAGYRVSEHYSPSSSYPTSSSQYDQTSQQYYDPQQTQQYTTHADHHPYQYYTYSHHQNEPYLQSHNNTHSYAHSGPSQYPTPQSTLSPMSHGEHATPTYGLSPMSANNTPTTRDPRVVNHPRAARQLDYPMHDIEAQYGHEYAAGHAPNPTGPSA